jgi:thiol-disulfide isomerase/thioredoxin
MYWVVWHRVAALFRGMMVKLGTGILRLMLRQLQLLWVHIGAAIAAQKPAGIARPANTATQLVNFVSYSRRVQGMCSPALFRHMKLLRYYLFIIASFSISDSYGKTAHEKKQTTLLFQIKTGANLYFSYPLSSIKFDEVQLSRALHDTVIRISVDTDKPFVIFNTYQGQTPYLLFPGYQYRCQVNPGNSKNLELKCDDPQKQFESNALDAVQNESGRFDLNLKPGLYPQLRASSVYGHQMDDVFLELYKSRSHTLRGYFDQGKMSKEGFYFLQSYLRYDLIKNRLRPFYTKRLDIKLLPTWYADTLKQYQIASIDTNLIQLYPVQGAAIYLNQFKALSTYKALTLAGQFEQARALPQTAVRDFLLYQVMNMSAKKEGTEYARYTDSLAVYTKNEQYVRIIRDNLTFNALSAKAAPDMLYDLKDHPVPFQKIFSVKDTVLYVDFWASWCVPCIQEMPSSAALKKQLAGHKVSFVYVSIDNSRDNWKVKSQSLGLQAQSYLLPKMEQSNIAHKIRLQTIPRYIIIKNGQIVDADAHRPSDPQLKALLLKYAD